MMNIDTVYMLLFIGTVSMSCEEDRQSRRIDDVVALILVYSKPLVKKTKN